jgi:hypothetical protein
MDPDSTAPGIALTTLAGCHVDSSKIPGMNGDPRDWPRIAAVIPAHDEIRHLAVADDLPVPAGELPEHDAS